MKEPYLNPDVAFESCCVSTHNFILGAIELGITSKELGILKKSLFHHPLDHFSRNKHLNKYTKEIDLEGLIDEVFEVSSFFEREEVSKYFLDRFYRLVQEQNNNPHWAIILAKFNKIWALRNSASSIRNQTTESIKILFLGANPEDTTRLRLDREIRDIEIGLKMSKERDNIELSQKWAITPTLLQQAILDFNPTIIHFSGHGTTDGIMLEHLSGTKQLVGTNALEMLFGLFSDKVKCVILNSCYSQEQAKAIANKIDFVIGMNDSIPDNAAIEFSVGFYRAIGAGRDVRFAYQLGINALLLQGIEGDGIPQLIEKKH